MRVYISGEITGKDKEEVFLKFAKSEELLRRNGYEISNPWKIGKKLQDLADHEVTYEEYMKADLRELKRCDLIYFIPNWCNSTGCEIERQFAIENNIPELEIRRAARLW